MRKSSTTFLTRTAILLALTITFQMMGSMLGPYNNYIVGSLVNACLLVAAATVGLWGGGAIAVIAPLMSALTNKSAIAPIIISFSPFIALGNFVLVLSFFLLLKKNKVAGIAISAALKFIVLYSSILVFLKFVTVKPVIATTLIGLFSWTQLFTACVGGLLALVVIKALGSSIDSEI